MQKGKVVLMVIVLAACSVFGLDATSAMQANKDFSIKNCAIESLSAFGVGGLSAIVTMTVSFDDGFAEMGRNSLIAYSIGAPIGSSSIGMLLRKEFAVRPLLFSAVGSLVGFSTGYLIADKNVKAGEFVMSTLVPLLSGIGVELSYCF